MNIIEPCPGVTLYRGDCVEVMRTMPDNSVDSIVVDPPYGLGKEPDMVEVLRHWLAGDDYKATGGGFMGKSWDSFVPGPSVWRECLRVLKPGGHLLSFFGSRTYDMGTLAIRLAGFQIRDQTMWLYGSGFPKSMDVSKAIDKAAGAEREVVGRHAGRLATLMPDIRSGNFVGGSGKRLDLSAITAPATDDAKAWAGWGTALKPAHEPICVARKPLIGTVASNVLDFGTGALHIDACRVGDEPITQHGRGASENRSMENANRAESAGRAWVGRWPANIILDGSPEVIAAFPDAPGQIADASSSSSSRKNQSTYGQMKRGNGRDGEVSAEAIYATTGGTDFAMKPGTRRGDVGSAARFFYCAKASPTDRNEGLPYSGAKFSHGSTLRDAENLGVERTGNHHPTVKPTSLMAYLCRLVTPPLWRCARPVHGQWEYGKRCCAGGIPIHRYRQG